MKWLLALFCFVTAAVFAVDDANAACWRTRSGQIIETQSNSTPPVSGAQRVTCPGPAPQITTPQAPRGRYPIEGTISQRYGDVWSRNAAKSHTGVDIVAPAGTPVPSMSAGRARLVNLGRGDGFAVVIEEPGGTARGYLHVTPSVSDGQSVAAGTEIGRVYSDHLHYNVCRRATLCERGALPTSAPDPAYPNDPLFPGDFRRP